MITAFIHKVTKFISRLSSTFLLKLILKDKRIRYGHGLQAIGIPLIEKHRGSQIQIGRNFVIYSSFASNPLGLNHKSSIRTLAKEAKVIIGDNVGISGASICAAKKVQIDSDVMLGANVQISDTDFHPLNPVNRRYNRNTDEIKSKDIIISKNVWVGSNVTILKGVTIGENSIIGAGSIVSRDVPSNVIFAGNPAKVVRKLD